MARKKHQDGDTITIKKYANRRLYNTATSSYVTLDNLAEMIKADEDIVVVEAKSGEDITHSVLTQIIFERESKDEDGMLPLPFLRQLISLYGGGIQQMVPGYLQNAMETLTQNAESMKKAFKEDAPTGGVMPVLEKMTQQNLKFLENTMHLLNAPESLKEGIANINETLEAKAKAKAQAKKDAEVKALKEQLSSLQKQIEALEN